MGACGVQMKAIRCKAITTLPENVEIVNEVDVVSAAGGLEPVDVVSAAGGLEPGV